MGNGPDQAVGGPYVICPFPARPGPAVDPVCPEPGHRRFPVTPSQKEEAAGGHPGHRGIGELDGTVAPLGEYDITWLTAHSMSGRSP